MDHRGLSSLCWLIVPELLSVGRRKTSEIQPTCLCDSKDVGPFILGFQNRWHISVPTIVYVRYRPGLLLSVHSFQPGLGWLVCISKHTCDRSSPQTRSWEPPGMTQCSHSKLPSSACPSFVSIGQLARSPCACPSLAQPLFTCPTACTFTLAFPIVICHLQLGWCHHVTPPPSHLL